MGYISCNLKLFYWGVRNCHFLQLYPAASPPPDDVSCQSLPLNLFPQKKTKLAVHTSTANTVLNKTFAASQKLWHLHGRINTVLCSRVAFMFCYCYCFLPLEGSAVGRTKETGLKRNAKREWDWLVFCNCVCHKETLTVIHCDHIKLLEILVEALGPDICLQVNPWRYCGSKGIDKGFPYLWGKLTVCENIWRNAMQSEHVLN